jgi:hypothetical protein
VPSSRAPRLRWPLLSAATALTVAAALVNGASAATPGSGTISPTAQTKTWAGHHYTAAATADPAACPAKSADPDDMLCDHFTLTVGVTSSYWSTHSGGAEVGISWTDGGNDFDLYVYNAAGDLVTSSAQGGTTSEKAVISKAAGTYEVRVLPYLVADSGYSGSAKFTSAAGGSTAPPLGGPAQYKGTRITGALPATEPQNVKIANTLPSLALKSGPVGRNAAEPTIGVDAKNAAFYAAATFDGVGGLARTELLRSKNNGNTWTKVTPPVVAGQSLPVTLDPYVYVEENSGRVFNLDLYVAGAYLSFSDDQGQTWTTNPIVRTKGLNDHQTLFAGPPPVGFNRALLTDPKFQEILYYCVNEVADSACARSFDGGRTFTETNIAYPGVEPMEGGAFCGGLHGHVAADRLGNVFLPKGHCGKPYIAVSKDAGTTWKRVRVSNTVDMPDNQSAVAADAKGNLFYVWYDSKYRLAYLATSIDHGFTWSKPLMIAPPNVREVQWPTIAAGANGRIAVTFPGTTSKDQGDLTRPWDYYVVTSIDALSPNPTFVSNIANPATDPVHRGDCPGRCGNMLDFLDVVVSPAVSPVSHPVWATVVDTCTTLKGCSTDKTAKGFDEATTTDNAAADMKGIYVRQIGGPRIGW